MRFSLAKNFLSAFPRSIEVSTSKGEGGYQEIAKQKVEANVL